MGWAFRLGLRSGGLVGESIRGILLLFLRWGLFVFARGADFVSE